MHAQACDFTIASGAAIFVRNYTLSNFRPGNGKAIKVFRRISAQYLVSRTNFSILAGIRGKKNTVVPEFAQINYYKAYSMIIARTSVTTSAVMVGAGDWHGSTKRWHVEEQFLIGLTNDLNMETLIRQNFKARDDRRLGGRTESPK